MHLIFVHEEVYEQKDLNGRLVRDANTLWIYFKVLYFHKKKLFLLFGLS